MKRPLMIGGAALGRRLLEKLERAGWVGWTVVDNDARLSSNIEKHVRPRGSHGLGLTGFINRLQTSGPGEKNARAEKRSPRERGGGRADLIVDVSGDPSVRGMLAAKNVSRCTAVIITPDGEDCVLLLEDWSRGLRLDGFEAQYYRWLLHLDSELESGAEPTAGVQRGRAGREAPTQTSPDALASHADALGRRIRSLVHKPPPAFIVSRHARDAGNAATYSVRPHPTLIRNICGWRIVWDKGAENRVLEMCWEALPHGAGGIILGYADKASKSIFVVDFRSPPGDGEWVDSAFERGVSGVSEDVRTARSRTGNVVTYIGEWRSRPDAMLPVPGVKDLEQLADSRDEMALNGHPPFIVTENAFCQAGRSRRCFNPPKPGESPPLSSRTRIQDNSTR